MLFRSLGLWAAALIALFLCVAPPAAAQTTSCLNIKDASATTQCEAVYNDGTHIFTEHLMGGSYGSGFKLWAMDTNGYGGVNIQNTPTVNLGTIGLASTAALQSAGNASLATLAGAVSGGVMSVTCSNCSGGGGGGAVTNAGTFAVQVSSSALPAGAATQTTLASMLAALGSPLQAGGSVSVTASALPAGAATSANQATSNASLATIATNTAVAGLGALATVPGATTNGTALGTLPAGGKGARFYLASSDSVTFTIATTAPASAPSVTFTISGASGGTGPNWDENLSGTAMIYVTATTGSPKFRWF